MTRLTKSFFVTQREAPSDAVAISHKLLLRAGFIRPLSNTAGLYTYGPMLWRVLTKVEAIIREELDKISAQELLLPQLHPAEIWQESGRWEVYKAENLMFRLTDGTGEQAREYGLGPTHEEAMCDYVRGNLTSYRQLPFTLYQIQTKFRNERRPRFGLMRVREFLMKDAYSFHTSTESLRVTYDQMYQVYTNVFTRCGLKFLAVEADSGAIGGSGSHEFMALAEIGEDILLYCEEAGYAANAEKAQSIPPEAVLVVNPGERTKVSTPGLKTVQQQADLLKLDKTQIVKNVLYIASQIDKSFPVVVSIRGDRQVNETKLKNHLNVLDIRLATDGEVIEYTAVKPGFLGVDAPGIETRIVDRSAHELKNFSTGANEKDQHWINANWQDYPELTFAVVDVDTALAGDGCHLLPTATLTSARGTEIGHIFQLGTKYSAKMNVNFADETGAMQPVIMGCYGLGVSRLPAALLEQSHDPDGMIWPWAIAPYHVQLILTNLTEEALETAELLYQQLWLEGIEVLMDDRDERAGVKFKDADLLGIPYRITLGRDLKEGLVEIKERATGTVQKLPVEDVLDFFTQLL